MDMKTNQDLEKIVRHFEFIYPQANVTALAQAAMTAFGIGVNNAQPRYNTLWDQSDALMITYGDTFLKEGEKPLKTLDRFLNDKLKGVINGVHILPFFPYTSDDGFAVQDYDTVRPDLGDWDDISEIAKDYRLMSDLVINHASSAHKWFKQFERDEAPGKDYIKTADPDDDLSAVVRPRPFALLRPTETSSGTKYVWCTFSHDQVDLDFSNPAVLIEFLHIMRNYIEKGVRIFRMDAIAFIWKEVGTSSLHLAQTHEIVKLMRSLADMRDETIILITETNVPNHENLQYFGNGNEAHMVYNFSLPPLLLHALLTGRSEHLRNWISSMPSLQNGCTYLNFTASHDGIGLRPVDGLLSQYDIDLMLNTIELFGGRVTTRTARQGHEKPYEMNVTYFDALKGTIQGEDRLQVERFIASQSVMMSMQGIPAFYVHSLLGTRNDYEKVERTQHNRAINRHQWHYDEITAMLADDTTVHARVFNEIKRRLGIRIKQPAFHPDAASYMMQPQSGFFGFFRENRGAGQLIYAITNLQPEHRMLSLFDLNLNPDEDWQDLIDGHKILDIMGDMEFAPYQTVWLTQKIH
jgi:sucrose phosphorylase